MHYLNLIERTAEDIAIGLLTIEEAESQLPQVRFTGLPNGRIGWRDYYTGLFGSKGARD